jgi:hypothetical protein
MKFLIPAALIAASGLASAADPAAEALKKIPLTPPPVKGTVLQAPGGKCFYIQTVRPVPDSKVEGGPRFTPIQWRAVQLKADSVCVGGGKLYEAALKK